MINGNTSKCSVTEQPQVPLFGQLKTNYKQKALNSNSNAGGKKGTKALYSEYLGSQAS
jgi:hypothetical protein